MISPGPFLVMNDEYYQYVHDNYYCQNPYILKELETLEDPEDNFRITKLPSTTYVDKPRRNEINDAHYIVITTSQKIPDEMS
ncbi:hypothetical protein JTB14_010528 [Gonioctena quinquepunctata]|nr:hypothetical protein JTB14_010528 [Gonioctena quinquepunctata]